MKIPVHKVLRLALKLLVLTLVVSPASSAQTSDEFREKYGKPEIVRLKGERVEVERYIIRPDIQMTVTYTERGQLCELFIEPAPSAPIQSSASQALMRTEVVINVINELVPRERRGEVVNVFYVNGGDKKMKLHHPGCTGIYIARYKEVTISSASWCEGGTFSATIHWEGTECQGQRIKNKR